MKKQWPLLLLLVVTVTGFFYQTYLIRNLRHSLKELRIFIASNFTSLNSSIKTFTMRRVNKPSTCNFVVATVTAYSPSLDECDDTPYTTSFLKRVHPNLVAVSRDLLRKGWIPGKKVYIEGVGVKEIGDLMSPKFKSPHIDVFMWKKEDALKFGKSLRFCCLLN